MTLAKALSPEIKQVRKGITEDQRCSQSKAPEYAVFMIRTDKGKTTIKAYDLTDNIARKRDIIIEEKPDDFDGTSFDNVLFDKLNSEQKEMVRHHIIEEFKN